MTEQTENTAPEHPLATGQSSDTNLIASNIVETVKKFYIQIQGEGFNESNNQLVMSDLLHQQDFNAMHQQIQNALDAASHAAISSITAVFIQNQLSQYFCVQASLIYNNKDDDHHRASLIAKLKEDLCENSSNFSTFISSIITIQHMNVGDIDMEQATTNPDQQLQQIIDEYGRLSNQAANYVRLNAISDVLNTNGRCIYNMLYPGDDYNAAYDDKIKAINTIKDRLINTTEKDGVWHQYSGRARAEVLLNALTNSFNPSVTSDDLLEYFRSDNSKMSKQFNQVNHAYPTIQAQTAQTGGRMLIQTENGAEHGPYFN